MIIGVSGKSGSGKSAVASYIAEKLNFEYLDMDIISRTIREEYKLEIAGIVNDDSFIVEGKVDSKKLGDILFRDASIMNEYNAFIYKKQKEALKNYSGSLVIDSMFLPIMEIFNDCDYKILVVCDDEIRYERILKRDSIGLEYLKKRDSFSLEYDEKKFDFIIHNDNDFKEEIDAIISRI